MAFDPILAALVKQFVSGDASAFCGIYDRLLETGDPRFLDFNYQLHRFCNKEISLNPLDEVKKMFPRELMDDPSAESVTEIVSNRIEGFREWEKEWKTKQEEYNRRAQAYFDRGEYFRDQVAAGNMTNQEMLSILDAEFPEFSGPQPMQMGPMSANATYNGED